MQFPTLSACFLAGLLAASATAAVAADEIRVALDATGTEGTAPLAVLFDASGSTSSAADTFRDVTYSFDFGDERGLRWAVTGKPKNRQVGGPLAAHVFDLPGTYVVRVQGRLPSGAASETSITVRVRDADEVYAGRKTVCVSRESDYTGCPAGAARQSSPPDSFSGKRVLLRRGESFGVITVPFDHRNVQVGAFCAGAPPLVETVQLGTAQPPVAARFPDEITVSDLAVREQIIQWASASRVLLYRNTVAPTSRADIQISLATGLPWWGSGKGGATLPASAYFWPREIFVVENVVQSRRRGTENNLFSSGSSRTALLGNDMGNAVQHTVRLGALERGVIAHNALRGGSADGMRHALKLHALGTRPYEDSFARTGNAWATARVVVADNLFGDGGDNNAWTVSINPQNDESAEGLEDVIVENNRFVAGTKTLQGLVLAGRRLTSRGNRRGDDAAIQPFTGGHGAALPKEWQGPYFAR